MVSAILPVFLVVGTAYVLRRKCPLDAKTLSTLNIYLFVPALVFGDLSQRELQWSLFARFAAGVVLMLLCMTAILALVARQRKLTGPAQSAFMMTQFMNLGNFGLPVCLFAFGKEGLVYAVVIMVCGSFLQNSVGVYFAQRTHYSVVDAIKRVLQLPLIYAFALALICQRTGVQLPLGIFRAVRITADAAIPIQLMILGILLAETRLDTGVDVFLATGIRLCGGPVLAFLLVKLVGLEGLAAKTFVLQMSGPIAVGMSVYGVQFNVSPRYLASVVAWSFLLSILSVSTVLFVLNNVSL